MQQDSGVMSSGNVSVDGVTLDELTRGDVGGRGLTVVAGGRRHTPHELDAAVSALAGALSAAGVRRGDVVAWQLPNCVEVFLLYRASWRLGAVAAPIHHQVGPDEVAAMIEQLGPAGWFGPGELPLPAGEPVEQSPAVPDDLAVVLFTSGSSGRPKGVRHTHRSLAYKMTSMVGVHGLGADDVSLMPLPMAHVSGLLNGLLVPAAAGMTTVLMDRWDATDGLDLIERERVSFMVGPPPLFSGIVDHPLFSPQRVASLRVVSTGAMGVSTEFVDAASRQLGAFVKRSYGATEIPTITTSAWSDPPEKARDTDGRVHGAGEIRLVDAATGDDVDGGRSGEVWFRGPEMFDGYLDAAATDAAMSDGWFRTGDLGEVDDEGWLRIVGRIKDVIIRGGENISPVEVQSVLEAHPSVRQAVAVGFPDERLGERVAAFVVADEPFDLTDCREWFAEREVARFKVPERLVRIDVIPTLPAGKPDLAQLRERLMNGGGSDGSVAER
jgi:cyclohexanecarboxylate-CoA ligase